MSLDTCVAPIYTRFLDKVERHIKYITSASSYVENLQNQRAVLNARKDDLKERIEEAERKSQRPTNEMVVWQEQAAVMLDKIDTTIHSAQETRSCAFKICSSHKIGRSCDGMLKEAELLAQSFEKLKVEMVDCDNSKLPIPMGYVVPESLDLNSAEAQKYIEDDESNSNVIGIWGLGGVGKTTLLKNIHNSCTGTSMEFKLVIWIEASRKESTNEKIQEKIVGKLGLKKEEDAHSQARIVHEFLRNKNFFLFIDNLWEAVNLHQIGVPSTYEEDPCSLKRKVIFTTRSKMVCGRMRADKIIEVKCLDSTKSWELFKKHVGEQILSDHRISKIAKDVVEECKGLPLAIAVIGQAMFKNKNVDEWKIALNQLKNSHDYHALDPEKQLRSVLKMSYDYLAGDLLKKCFLSISMWPESRIIGREELIEFWMGLGFIDNFETVDQAYEIGHSLIRSLQDACLLEHVEKVIIIRSCHDYEDAIKMHDVIRDLALWIASDYEKSKNKWMIKAGIGLREAPSIQAKWSEAECISLMNNEIKELPSGISSCPNLSTLILKGNYFAESEFDFGKFHSLTYLDLSYNSLDHFPKSICGLTELQYLNMSYNDITELPVELKNLKKLKYLKLRGNSLINVPQEIFSELSKLLMLDMFHAYDSGIYSFIDIKALLKGIENQLLYFGATVCSEENLDELMSLSKLCIKELSIQRLHDTSFHFLSKLGNHHRLKRLYIQYCGGSLSEIVFDQKEIHQDLPPFNLEYLWIASLRNLRMIIWKDITPKRLFAELREVHIAKSRLEDISWVIHLPSLKRLILFDCKSMRIAINNDLDSMDEPFPSLELLILFDMYNLEQISTRPIAFGQLKNMHVFGCPLLKALPFSANTAPKLAMIYGEEEWCEKLEWDVNSRVHFNQFFVHSSTYTRIQQFIEKLCQIHYDSTVCDCCW